MVPTKLAIQLRLDPISSVPVNLKDVVESEVGPKMAVLLANDVGGPPGKIFPLNVLQHVRAGGPAARVVPDEDCSDEQLSWFSKLVDELEKGNLVCCSFPFPSETLVPTGKS